MTRPRPAPLPVQRAVGSAPDVAGIFGKGETWFRERQAELEAAGFPPYDDLIDGWNLYLCAVWFEGRQPAEGATKCDDGLQHRLEALKNGQL